MRVISIAVNFDIFVVSMSNIKSDKVNTNTLVDGVLYYTERFLKRNSSSVSSYLASYEFTEVEFNDFESFFIVINFINPVKVKFNVNKSLSSRVMDTLLDNTNIKSLECYFMPSDYVHLFAESGFSIKFNNDMMFNSEFVSSNNLKNLKGIYYKRVINFYTEEEVKYNLEAFLKVNEHLKLIHLYCYSNDIIDFVIDKLDKYNFIDVDIFIHQNSDNASVISKGASHLRKVNKEYSNLEGREIRIIYSNEFFRNNIFKQLTLNGMKLSMIIVLYMGLTLIVSNKYQEYISLLNLRILENELLESASEEEIVIDEINDEEIETPVEENPTPTPPSDPEEHVNRYANVPTSFDKLLKINSDVVGWIKVNNTKTNYAVTQGEDNKYYLKHDIYKKAYTTGWIFMDYRNDPVNLNKNTIIYGHNLRTGYMFGGLRRATNRNWYLDSNNQIITFNTVEKNMGWKIFSVYKTDYTTDYLKVDFYGDEDFMSFVDMIKSRSIYNFNVNVGTTDKILTLSTCSGSNDRRLVVHAVLVD